MRTRLDEIVEEEIARVDTGGEFTSAAAKILHAAHRAAAKVIAERAFRHGAERHAWAAANVVPQMVPAPAEEKLRPASKICVDCQHEAHGDKMCFVCTVDMTSLPWSTLTGTCNCGDRRHGERRKGMEGRGWIDDGTPGTRIYRLGGPLYKFKFDRRKGKDRRKPSPTGEIIPKG